MSDINLHAEIEQPAADVNRSARPFAIFFWVLFGTLGSVVGTAFVVSEFCPSLTSEESFRLIWSVAIPLALTTSVIGFFATKIPAVREWSIRGLMLLTLVALFARFLFQLLG